jgi:hypothetical protein
MLAALGIILLAAGLIVTFALDRSAEGIDLIATGWILMAGGGLALLGAMIQDAGSAAEPRRSANGRFRVQDLGRG